MKWRGRRQSKNVRIQDKDDIAEIITKEEYKKSLVDKQTKKARNSALKVKDIKRHKDPATDAVNYFNMTPVEQRANARRLRQLKDTAKPQHLIPASKKGARIR